MAETRFLVTDITRMSGASVCVAGFIHTDDGYQCVRPVLADRNIQEDWLNSFAEPIRPFSILTLHLWRQIIQPPHIEDWLFEEDTASHLGHLQIERRVRVLTKTLDRSVSELFTGQLRRDDEGGRWWVPHGAPCRSLGTIQVSTPRVWFDAPREAASRWRYTLQFKDALSNDFRVTITDLVARRYLQSLVRDQGLTTDEAGRHMGDQLRSSEHCFLRLGLARPWRDYPDRCYLQVTGIFSFPDYLGGRCHADFPVDYA